MPSVGTPPPSDWPYSPRDWVGALTEQSQQTILGFGGDWTLRLANDVRLEGPGGPMSEAFGRGGVGRIGTTVLRPYRRGGLVRHVNRSTYLGTERFHAEYEVHAHLFALGFPTVEPLGYGFRRRGLGYQGLYFTRWAEATPWPLAWAKDPGVPPGLVLAVKALTSLGCWAPDLNATNVLVTLSGDALLLDWDRAALGVEGNLMAKYRARLLRSLQKLRAPSDVIVGLATSLSPSRT